ncbi:imidazole glycerol phosphate synthase subunit HisH [Chloroflexota bacterium]
MITIIDYGAGNLRSVINAVDKLGYQSKVTSKPADILNAKTIILPGVGAAADTMNNLMSLDLVTPIRRYINDDRPFLGICIGLQILFTDTVEGGWQKCLNIIPGSVNKLPTTQKIPHMGWNQVKQRINHSIFNGIPDEANFYFVHSYYGVPEDKSIVIGETDYGLNICSVLARGSLIATQFHPEKSGEFGLKLYDNFIRITSCIKAG